MRGLVQININFSLTLVQIGWGKDVSKDDDLKLTQIDVAVRSQAYCNYVLNKGSFQKVSAKNIWGGE